MPDGSAFVLDKITEADSRPVQGATASGRLVEPTDSASISSIRSNSGKSQEKSSGRASVEMESRTADNETGYSDDKKPSFDNETARAFVKSYSALQRVVDERTAAYQEATKADDQKYDYETESKWLSRRRRSWRETRHSTKRL